MKDKEETFFGGDGKEGMRFGEANLGYLRLFLLGAVGGAPCGSLPGHAWGSSLSNKHHQIISSLPEQLFLRI